ncbi:DUF1501 domain-containing protein [Fuerstiella marisgermanici]|uniref:DUF1501 domain-containing protein n=1 Tax=Fuerstiella marisgermanici TaxID=1891926 RepID=A0A1P8WQ30_9PLAN|nr:DUF1501 domain-containing protein [Fuerstiella marisgermanici]APZ96159.1 hypothetical protein Fuma_05827 [Fuerstiella marisgermanici]
MTANYACNSPEHVFARRQFLGTMAGGFVAGGLGALTNPLAAAELNRKQMRVLVVFLAGGVSQLESWDPKPKTDTGGPFRAIPTAVPGMHISELLPLTAVHMDKLALVRSINTNNNDHAKGRYQMVHGRNQMPGQEYPHLGAVCAKGLERSDNPLPGYIKVGGGSRGSDAAYLGPKYASVGINGKPPANSARPSNLTEDIDIMRNKFRQRANERFQKKRRTAETDVYTETFEQARQLMEKRDVFDVEKEPASEKEKYGDSQLGRHSLMARRLLENGIPFVQIQHSNYDTHNENFNFHLEQMGEFDRAFSALMGDLSDRGMLETTLVVVMSEFGRTPRINARYGRDHWGKAWSVCLGGAGIQSGAIIGATNANGTEVSDREVDHGHLFHTYLSAVGMDSLGSFDIGGRDTPVADPSHGPISELLV